MLEYEIRLPVRHACVHQFGNMRMRKLAENSAFALEPLLTTSRYREMQELYRHTPLETAITALRQPNTPHPTLTDRRNNPRGPDCPPRPRGFSRNGRGSVFEELLLFDGVVLFQ